MIGLARSLSVLGLTLLAVVYHPITLGDASLDAVSSTGLPAQERNDDNREIQPNVVGGSETDIESFPWVVAIVSSQNINALSGFRCGGTLAAGDWVMTSAHCVLEGNQLVPSQDLRVITGRADLTETSGYSIEVNEIHAHPNFDNVTGDYDIALVRLSSWLDDVPVPISFLDSQPLAEAGSNATVVGWGSTVPSDDQVAYPSILRMAVLNLTDASQCQQALRMETGLDIVVTDNMLCADSSFQAVDACTGDSGGPLLYWNQDLATWDQIGIVSWGIGCAIQGQPGVYTNLHSMKSWIQTTLANELDLELEPDIFTEPIAQDEPILELEDEEAGPANSYYFPFLPLLAAS